MIYLAINPFQNWYFCAWFLFFIPIEAAFWFGPAKGNKPV